MNINYEYYRVFYHVAKHGSATRAAEALMTNQPNITHTIRRLEDVLGLKLFVRSNHGMALTRDGERLYAHVRVAIESLQRGEEELASTSSLQGGSITLSASEVALRCFLLPVLRAFHDCYPGVKLKVLNHSTPQAVAAVRSGQAELAIVTTPIDDHLQSLRIRSIMEFQETAVCGPTLASLAERELTLDQLLEHPVISLNPDTTTYRFYEDWFLSHRLHFHADIEAATADLILPMVENDLGVGFVPEAFLDEAATSRGVRRLRLKEIIPPRSICMIKRGDATPGIAAKELERMCLLRAGIGDEGPSALVP